MYHDGAGVYGRLLDPKRFEQKEFLALGLAGIDGQSAGRLTVDFTFATARK
jgi:hypothetical protein